MLSKWRLNSNCKRSSWFIVCFRLFLDYPHRDRTNERLWFVSLTLCLTYVKSARCFIALGCTEVSSVLMMLCVFERFQAINSLNKYPLPLQTAKEAKILQNFGDGICKLLDDKLQRYYRENGIYNMCVSTG